jgi:hypothetical protein
MEDNVMKQTLILDRKFDIAVAAFELFDLEHRDEEQQDREFQTQHDKLFADVGALVDQIDALPTDDIKNLRLY